MGTKDSKFLILMGKTSKKTLQRARVRRRIRGIISGTLERPRLSIFRSNKHVYAQLIDDLSGNTLAQADSREVEADVKTDRSQATGKLLAERAKEVGIDRVVFDRGGYRYHGNVKALAEGAREGGLSF